MQCNLGHLLALQVLKSVAAEGQDSRAVMQQTQQHAQQHMMKIPCRRTSGARTFRAIAHHGV